MKKNRQEIVFNVGDLVECVTSQELFLIHNPWVQGSGELNELKAGDLGICIIACPYGCNRQECVHDIYNIFWFSGFSGNRTTKCHKSLIKSADAQESSSSDMPL